MLVSHDHQFVFLKTRKTGGTSVEMALQPFCTRPGVAVREETRTLLSPHGIVGRRKLPPRKRRDADQQWFNHMPAARIARQLGGDVFGRYARVTCVRNPYARFVSIFHWRRRGDAPDRGGMVPDGAGLPAFEAVRQAFTEFALEGGETGDAELVTVDGMFVPDLVIHFEHLADDLETVRQALGLGDGRLPLPHAKDIGGAQRGWPVPAYFTPETVDVIRDAMAWAFDIVGYDPDPERFAEAPRDRIVDRRGMAAVMAAVRAAPPGDNKGEAA